MALRRKDWPPPSALFAAAAHDLLDPEQAGETDAAPALPTPPTPPACSESLAAAAETSRLLAAYLLGGSDLVQPAVPPTPASARADSGAVASPRPGGATGGARREKPKRAPDERSGGGGGGGGGGGARQAASSAKKARRADRTPT